MGRNTDTRAGGLRILGRIGRDMMLSFREITGGLTVRTEAFAVFPNAISLSTVSFLARPALALLCVRIIPLGPFKVTLG
jgi:hypothetical protein